MSKPKFNCTQAVFVVVVETILNSMEEFLAQITPRRPKYKLSWITDARAALVAADLLPDEAARQAISSIIRVELLALNAQCCQAWQELADFIRDAFAADIVDIQLKAAGYERYEKAADKKWPETKAMMNSAKTFLTANLATLTANENMDPAFATEFGNLVTAFNAKLSAYESSKEAVPLATDAKVDAFNAVYDTIRPMMDFVQKIFRDNESVRTQFVFSNVVDRVSGHGLAGARGTIFSTVNLFPIQGALVEYWLEATPAVRYFAVTDADGKYLITSPSGDYKLKVSAPGYEDSGIKDISIAVGTISTFNEKLTPLEGNNG